ncbi:MAG: SusC/RagA family TonB-linked outer membrane protein, partial [Cyclobacteriaceae bacterium]|nr:SusC/RagA family TonB-linked outer membrane protein [Cyclobacteriaceae bacterium]
LVGNKLDLLNGPQFGELQNDIAAAQGRPQVYPNPSALTTTDWQDESIRNATIANHNLSISGGTKAVNYFVSGDYFKQDGINVGSGYNRSSIRTNLDIKASKKLSFGLSMLLSSQNKELKNPYDDQQGLLVLPPTLPVYNPDGTFNFDDPESSTGVFLNPIAFIEESINQEKRYRMLGNIYFDYKIVDGLTLKQSFGLDLGFGKDEEFIPGSISQYQGVTGGIASLRRSDFSQWSSTTTLNYNKTFGANHSLNALAVFEAQKREGSWMSSRSTNFPSDALTFNRLQAGIEPGVPQSGISSPFQLLSYLGRINYTFASKYLFTVTGRYDGSSRFGAENRYAFFPSVALGWRLSDEDFLQSAGIVDNLKLRASWGQTGNQEIGSFRSLVLFNSVTQPFRTNQTVGFKPKQMANPNLKWETTTQIDVGLDFGLWDSRLRGSFDYYRKETTDLLLNADIPSTSGFGSTLANVGSLENKGWEIELESDVVDAKIGWTTGLVMSANRNKVLSLGGLPPIQAGASFGDKKFPNSGVIEEGEEIGVFLGYKTDGIWQSDSDIQNARDNIGEGNAFPRAGDTRPGDYRYIDHNGDGNINEDDIVKLGSNNPDFIWGWSNTI